jgi:ribosome-associated toxin RatA of RatAB toxin-antitoxin module
VRPPALSLPLARIVGLLFVLAAPVTGLAGPITTEVDRDDDGLLVKSSIEANAPAATCFDTIADLDHLAEFVPGLKVSRIVSPPGAPIELHQVGEAKAGPFGVTLDVTLAVSLDPPRLIEFRRIAGNLDRMQGSWSVSGDDRTCRIDYHAALQPAFWVPPLVGPMMMRRQVDEQMAGVLAEITRRASGQARH